MKNKRNWFIALFAIFNVVAGILYFLQPRLISPFGIALICTAILVVALLSFISFKALIGASLAEAFVLVLFLPLVLFLLYLRQPILRVALIALSDLWQVWVATEGILAFVLLHRNILRIKTPLGEIEMPPPTPGTEIEMPPLEF